MHKLAHSCNNDGPTIGGMQHIMSKTELFPIKQKFKNHPFKVCDIRVAQNKISPPENMQYLRNQWPGFKNSRSCLMLTLLHILRWGILFLATL